MFNIYLVFLFSPRRSSSSSVVRSDPARLKAIPGISRPPLPPSSAPNRRAGPQHFKTISDPLVVRGIGITFYTYVKVLIQRQTQGTRIAGISFPQNIQKQEKQKGIVC